MGRRDGNFRDELQFFPMDLLHIDDLFQAERPGKLFTIRTISSTKSERLPRAFRIETASAKCEAVRDIGFRKREANQEIRLFAVPLQQAKRMLYLRRSLKVGASHLTMSHAHRPLLG
jgi:hypothetical protein